MKSRMNFDPQHMEIPIRMSPHDRPAEPAPHESWYRYGVVVLALEMLIAAVVSVYSLLMTFHGMGGFSGST